MNIATYADGRPIGYDEASGALDVGGTPVTVDQLRGYAAAGQVTWASSNVQQWFESSFPADANVAAATQPKKRSTGLIVAVVAGVLLISCGACAAVSAFSSGSKSATTSQPAASVVTSSAQSPGKAEPVAAPVAAPTPPPAPAAPPAPTEPEPVQAPAPTLTTGQEQAVQKAQSYLDMGGFSKKSLTKQLAYEGFSNADSKFAVDYIAPDWNAQAVQKAKAYMEMGGFSKASLLKQLEYEGFTTAQAKYGAKAVGY